MAHLRNIKERRVPLVRCSFCERSVEQRRPSKSGLRCCDATECRKKYSAEYRRWKKAHPELVQTNVKGQANYSTDPCDNCGDPVARTRDARYDIPRYCSKPECRKIYRQKLSRAKGRIDAAEDIQFAQDSAHLIGYMVDYVKMAFVIPGGRLQCQSCGRADAVLGYVHPTPESTELDPVPCKGTTETVTQIQISNKLFAARALMFALEMRPSFTPAP